MNSILIVTFVICGKFSFQEVMGNLLRILYSKDTDSNKSDIFLDFESECPKFFSLFIYLTNKLSIKIIATNIHYLNMNWTKPHLMQIVFLWK